jgi:hypothetical protein
VRDVLACVRDTSTPLVLHFVKAISTPTSAPSRAPTAAAAAAAAAAADLEVPPSRDPVPPAEAEGDGSGGSDGGGDGIPDARLALRRGITLHQAAVEAEGAALPARAEALYEQALRARPIQWESSLRCVCDAGEHVGGLARLQAPGSWLLLSRCAVPRTG